MREILQLILSEPPVGPTDTAPWAGSAGSLLGRTMSVCPFSALAPPGSLQCFPGLVEEKMLATLDPALLPAPMTWGLWLTSSVTLPPDTRLSAYRLVPHRAGFDMWSCLLPLRLFFLTQFPVFVKRRHQTQTPKQQLEL